MRLTSLAAGIFSVAIIGYIGVATVAPAKGAAPQNSTWTHAFLSP